MGPIPIAVYRPTVPAYVDTLTPAPACLFRSTARYPIVGYTVRCYNGRFRLGGKS